MRALACLFLLICATASGLSQPAGAVGLPGDAALEQDAHLQTSPTQGGVTSTSRHHRRPVAHHASSAGKPSAALRRDILVTAVARRTSAASLGDGSELSTGHPDLAHGSTRSTAPPLAPDTKPAPAKSAIALQGALIPGLPTSMTASIVGLRAGADPQHPVPVPARVQDVSGPGPAARSTTGGERTGAAADVSSGETGCLLLPAGRVVGLAMFRRSSQTVVVVDQQLGPLGSAEGDWWELHTPQVIRTARWTAVRVPTSSGDGLRIERREDGLCLIGTQAAAPTAAPVVFHAGNDSVQFSLQHPGNTLTVTDPVTGSLLLVGTDAGNSGAVRTGRRSALFAIDGTLAGIVVEPFSDRLQLHRTSSGFDLVSDGATSIHVTAGFSDTPVASVDGLTRTLSFAAEPTEALVRRMHERALAAAAAPPRARSDRRLDLAEAMVALGLGSEASSVLAAASADDPSAAASPRAALLGAIASILDPGERGPDPFGASAYPSTEEGKLWRALAWQPPAPVGAAIATIRRGMPLLVSYPARLREAAATQAARVLLAGQDPDGLRAIDLLPDSAAIRLARAEARARLGHPAAALAALAELARSRDIAVMANSLRDVIRLKLASGRLTNAAAADLLDAHRLDWRITGQEAPALIEEADDRLRVPDARAAFELWHEALAIDPTVRAQVEPRRLAALSQLAQPASAARVSASDYASIIAENMDLIAANGDLAARTGLILADKFADLGLEDHAAATLDRLVVPMPAGTARAVINTRLASLDVARGAPAAATAALSRDDEAGCPIALVDRRKLIRARALDMAGKSADALALLAAATSEDAVLLKAQLLMERQDWHAALVPLNDLFHRLPTRGPLDATQGAVVLQLVAASVRDGTAASATAAKGIEPRLADASERRSLAVLMAPLAAPADRVRGAATSGI